MATINAVNTNLSGQTGTGSFVGSNSPILVTPNIGVATATSLAFQGSATLSMVTGTLSIGQITSMYTTPVQLIAAPGAGFAIIVITAYVNYIYDGSHAITGGGTVDITYGSVAHGGSNSALNNANFAQQALFTNASSSATFQMGIATTNVYSASSVANKGIFITNETGVFVANSSTATANYVVSYLTVPMS